MLPFIDSRPVGSGVWVSQLINGKLNPLPELADAALPKENQALFGNHFFRL